MSEQITTGVEYPTIELAGVTFTLKFTRGAMLYRLSKSGTAIADMNARGTKTLSAVIDVLHAALFGQFNGTPEELSDLVMNEGKMKEARTAVDIALGKVFPPSQTTAVTAGETKPASVASVVQ